jgi:hypothetical protein
MQIKSCLPFSNSNPQFKPTDIIMTPLNRGTKPMKDWEIIADHLSKAGWCWGCVSAIDSNGRTIWIADAHRDDGKRYVVRADELCITDSKLDGVI